jgi:hypothetical protein
VVICVKEVIKATLTVGTLCNSRLLSDGIIHYYLNSPALLLFLLDPSYRKVLASAVEADVPRPWAIAIDMVVEDLPQLIIPCLLLRAAGSVSELGVLTFVSLTGSLLMATVNTVRFVAGVKFQMAEQRQELHRVVASATALAAGSAFPEIAREVDSTRAEALELTRHDYPTAAPTGHGLPTSRR